MNFPLYALLLIFTLAGPLSRSFENQIAYYKKFPALFSAIGICAFFFILKDHQFAAEGVWGFNPKYLLGPKIYALPIEEILFFIIVPYSCIFIYESLNFYMTKDILGRAIGPLFLTLAFGLAVLASCSWQKAYTASYSLTAVILLVGLFLVRHQPRFWFLGRLFLSYLVGLVPFFMINGILTGSFLAEPIVWYNSDQNLGLRMGTIPVEDLIYFLCMQLSYVSLYEIFLNRRKPGP